MRELSEEDFTRINFNVFCCDIDGGFFKGGTSIIINLQNSHKLFIDSGSDRREWPITSFNEGIDLANKHFQELKS